MGGGARGGDRDRVTIGATQKECRICLIVIKSILRKVKKKYRMFFGNGHYIYSISLVYIKREHKMLLLNLNCNLYLEKT